MKLSILFLSTLAAVIFSCSPRQSSEQKSKDSTTVPSDKGADSLSILQEGTQSNDEPEKGDVENHTSDVYSRNGVKANVSQYKFLGFSEDLTYAAFAIGWHDNSKPEVTAKLYVVNVEKNSFVGKPVTAEISNAEFKDAVDRLLIAGAPQLSTYRISGENIGTSCYVDSESNVDIPFDNKIYKLKLIQKSASDANKFFELQVLTDGEPIILQSDSFVPASRGKVVSYKVVALFVLEDKVAVFVEYSSPDMMDYENHRYYNVRQLMVTGSLVQKQD